MDSSESVVSNTSPLLNLALVDRLSLLSDQFEQITVPPGVREELLAGPRTADKLTTLLDSDFVHVRSVSRRDLVVELQSELDRGESEAIALALEIDAERLLLDEREGRAVARRHEIPITGVVGVLIRAAAEGTVEITDALDELREAGFWIDDALYEKAVSQVSSVDSR